MRTVQFHMVFFKTTSYKLHVFFLVLNFSRCTRLQQGLVLVSHVRWYLGDQLLRKKRRIDFGSNYQSDRVWKHIGANVQRNPTCGVGKGSQNKWIQYEKRIRDEERKDFFLVLALVSSSTFFPAISLHLVPWEAPSSHSKDSSQVLAA
jgi:hypothetical protein